LGVADINEHGREFHSGWFECTYTKEKGRVLHATRDFAEGDIILEESPLHIVQEDENNAAFRRLKELCKDFPDDFDYEPLWYWCALKSLTEEQLRGVLLGGWDACSKATQHKLLLLHHDGVCEASSSSEILARELAPGIDAVTIERLTQIWVLNCFEYSDSPQGYSTYFFSSFMSHSCWPNAVWRYSGSDHVLRARRNIKAGDEVTISYLPEHGLLQTTPARRAELHDTKRFWCACERCTAPQDLSRGFVCPKCSNGKVFARTPELGPAKDDTLLATQLWAIVCNACGAPTDQHEAQRLTKEEAALKRQVEDISERARGSLRGGSLALSLVELQAAEAQADAIFVQHASMDLLWEQLSDCYARRGNVADQRRLLRRRCDFHHEAYEGLNGAHAWALEALADAMLQTGTQSGTSGKRDSRTWPDPREALRLYDEAFQMLKLMFGLDHEYVTQVERKCQSAKKLLPPSAAKQSSA